MAAPKGKLLVIGGAENKGEYPEGTENGDSRHYEILKKMMPVHPRNGQGIEIITTASGVPQKISRRYTEAFARVGYRQVRYMHMVNKAEARNPAYIRRIQKAHTVFFAGGDQFRLAGILGCTPIVEAVRERYLHDENFILAGTSAGAMAMPTLMLYEGRTDRAMLKGSVKIASGLGFMEKCLIDTHFIKRGRFGRLVQAVLMNPACIGIGLGEDTAFVIRKGNEAVCCGSGMAILVDARDVGHTNIAYVDEGAALCVENLRVHILKKGDGFVLDERKFIPAKEDLRQENELRK